MQQQRDAKNHAGTGQEIQFMLTTKITMKKKFDLSDFNCNMKTVT